MEEHFFFSFLQLPNVFVYNTSHLHYLYRNFDEYNQILWWHSWMSYLGTAQRITIPHDARKAMWRHGAAARGLYVYVFLRWRLRVLLHLFSAWGLCYATIRLGVESVIKVSEYHWTGSRFENQCTTSFIPELTLSKSYKHNVLYDEKYDVTCTTFVGVITQCSDNQDEGTNLPVFAYKIRRFWVQNRRIMFLTLSLSYSYISSSSQLYHERVLALQRCWNTCIK